MSRGRRSGRTEGFSLIELLIVVAVIVIVAALAVPSLMSSKKAAFEASAISYMRTWTAAQELYFLKNGAYADADQQLIAEGLVGNPNPDDKGYIFSIDNPPKSRTAWWGSAVPSNPGVTGDRFFYIDNTGVIRANLGGPAGPASAPLGAP
jgi:prepilin-type N-terminal cleavage/methylation domain-containing protein